jgi:hypothetical protein
MSLPKEPDPVKLIASLFSTDGGLIERVIVHLERTYGPADWISPEILFDRTRYYAKEMGWPLYRRFIAFSQLIPPQHLVDVKLCTNQVEQEYLQQGNRQINVDPGYVAAERLILATGKNYVHRVYLDRGIYADLTLVYKRRSYRPLEWTYPDYADPQTIAYFNEVRDRYMAQLRDARSLNPSTPGPPLDA